MKEAVLSNNLIKHSVRLSKVGFIHRFIEIKQGRPHMSLIKTHDTSKNEHENAQDELMDFH